MVREEKTGKISNKEYDKLIREKKFCPLCKYEDYEDVKLKIEIVEDSAGKRKAYVCPKKHSSLYRIERLD